MMKTMTGKELFIQHVMEAEGELNESTRIQLKQAVSYLSDIYCIEELLDPLVIKKTNLIITTRPNKIGQLRFTNCGDSLHYYPQYHTYHAIDTSIERVIAPHILSFLSVRPHQNPINIASRLVYYLLSFHFFSDGNGRLAHLLFNRFLQLYHIKPNIYFFCDFKPFFVLKLDYIHVKNDFVEIIDSYDASDFVQCLEGNVNAFSQYVISNIKNYE